MNLNCFVVVGPLQLRIKRSLVLCKVFAVTNYKKKSDYKIILSVSSCTTYGCDLTEWPTRRMRRIYVPEAPALIPN